MTEAASSTAAGAADVRSALGDLLVAADEGEGRAGSLSDFGHVVERTPLAVAAAGSRDDAARAFAAAAELSAPVVIRGTSHSCGGQSLADDAVVLVNRIQGPIEWVSETSLEIPTGLSWHAVETEANARGRAVPVLPSVLDISVGGTLAVGGYGTNSPARGPQIDHVTELELLAPDGGVHRCSRDENEELFRMALAGSGQLGLITRARIETTEHLPDVELAGYRFDSLSVMAESLGWMDDPGAQLPPYLRAFSYKPERPGIALYGDLHAAGDAPAEDPGRGRGLETVRAALGQPATALTTENVRMMEHEFDLNWVGRYPGHRRLWIDYGFSYEAFRSYCAEVERRATEGEFGRAIRAVYVSVAPAPPGGSDLFPFDIRPSGVERTFTCGLYCMVPMDEPETLARVRAALGSCHDLMTELGGRPYVYGFNQMGPMDWRRAFGSDAVDGLLAAKERVDPGRAIPPPWDRIDREPDPGGAPAWAPKFRPGAGGPGAQSQD
jgi:FAD/FMN-containing dehydrogenase